MISAMGHHKHSIRLGLGEVINCFIEAKMKRQRMPSAKVALRATSKNWCDGLFTTFERRE